MVFRKVLNATLLCASLSGLNAAAAPDRATCEPLQQALDAAWEQYERACHANPRSQACTAAHKAIAKAEVAYDDADCGEGGWDL